MNLFVIILRIVHFFSGVCSGSPAPPMTQTMTSAGGLVILSGYL